MLIETEETYHPNVRNFYFGTEMLAKGVAEYADRTTQNASELAQNILEIGGICRVLILPDMIYVQKENEADFAMLEPQIMAEIVEFDFSKYADFDFSKQDKNAQIEALVEAKIRPFLKSDGGDMEILSFKNGVLNVRLQGRCKGCPHADETLKKRVEAILKNYLPDVLCVQGEKA